MPSFTSTPVGRWQSTASSIRPGIQRSGAVAWCDLPSIAEPVSPPTGCSTAPGLYNPLHFYPLPSKAVEDLDHKDIRFFEMNSATRGCGGKMADAVLKDLPKAMGL